MNNHKTISIIQAFSVILLIISLVLQLSVQDFAGDDLQYMFLSFLSGLFSATTILIVLLTQIQVIYLNADHPKLAKWTVRMILMYLFWGAIAIFLQTQVTGDDFMAVLPSAILQGSFAGGFTSLIIQLLLVNTIVKRFNLEKIVYNKFFMIVVLALSFGYQYVNFDDLVAYFSMDYNIAGNLNLFMFIGIYYLGVWLGNNLDNLIQIVYDYISILLVIAGSFILALAYVYFNQINQPICTIILGYFLFISVFFLMLAVISQISDRITPMVTILSDNYIFTCLTTVIILPMFYNATSNFSDHTLLFIIVNILLTLATTVGIMEFSNNMPTLRFVAGLNKLEHNDKK